MKIVMVSSEARPFCKTGGLADVVYSLSKELAVLGEDVSIIIPLYDGVRRQFADEELKKPEDILAVYTGNKIDGFGRFFSFIRTQLGFFLVILLPMILFFVYEAVRVIMNIIAYNKEKAAEEAAAAVANSELTEEQKQRAIEEYLAQQKLKQESEPTVQTPAEGDQSNADL